MIDLHIHTNASDGEYSTKEIMEMSKGLDYIAITDHDTLAGLKDLNDNVIKGIELSCQDKDCKKIHIVGLGINPECKELNDALNNIIELRDNRAKEYIKLLNEDDINFTYEDLKKVYPKGGLRKNHFAKYLFNNRLINDEEELFIKYFKTDRYKLPEIKDYLLPIEAINLIHKAGGKAILAHPQKMKTDIDKKIDELVSHGLDGIEVYHSDMNNEDNKHYIDIANKYNLLKSVGSYFHGPNVVGNENKKLGTGINNNIVVDSNIYKDLLDIIVPIIDMHIHTNNSDGKMDVEDVLKLALNNNCKYISITDHNNISAYDQITDTLGLNIIRGVEVDSDYTKHYDDTIHILAYNYNVDKMNEYLNKINKQNKDRLLEYISIFKKNINPYISYEEFDEYYKGSKVRSIARLLKYMIKKCYINDIKEVIKKYNLESNYDNVNDTVKALKETNATVILAHPWRYESVYNISKKEIEKMIYDLMKCGLDGIEAIYSRNSEEQTKHWIDFAKKNNLVITCGSDFHRIGEPERKDKIEIGRGINNNMNIHKIEIFK